MVRKTDLRARAALLEPDLERLDQAQEQRVVQEAQVLSNSLRADVPGELALNLASQGRDIWSLADVPARQGAAGIMGRRR